MRLRSEALDQPSAGRPWNGRIVVDATASKAVEGLGREPRLQQFGGALTVQNLVKQS